MNRVTNGVGIWAVASATLAAAAGETRPPVEAVIPKIIADAGEAAHGEEGPNSGGPGTSAEEEGAPAPAAGPVGTVGSEIPAVRQGMGGIWAPGKLPGERPIPVLSSLAGGKPATKEPIPTNPVDLKPIEPNSPRPAEPSPAEPRPGQRGPENAATPTNHAPDPLDAQVDEAIEVTARRVLIAETRNRNERPHTPWQIGHGMLAFRQNYVVRVNGEKVKAYDWLATNPVYQARVKRGKDAPTTVENLTWFYLTPHGARPQKFTGEPYEFEGHPNQFLAFFALARIPLDFEFTIQGRKITYGDMLHNAKMEVNDREEVTWDLWAFAYYFDMNEQWRNAKGEAWSMERLVTTTMRQFANPKGAPCGGCHALFALASARNSYLQSGNKLTGAWMQAHMLLEKHIALAKSMQNADGSFSGIYFKGPKYWDDPSKRISTNGHTLEFLMLALQQNRLKEPWVRRSVAAVARDLVQYQSEPLEVGGMYHAVHALVLYRERTRVEFATAPGDVQPVSVESEKAEDARSN